MKEDEKQIKKDVVRLVAHLGFGWTISLTFTFMFVAIVTFAVFAEIKPFGAEIDSSSYPLSWVILIWVIINASNGAHARKLLNGVLKTDGGTAEILGMFEREAARNRVVQRWSFGLLLAVAMGIWMSLEKWGPT